jgi:thymidylate synthase ThyX
MFPTVTGKGAIVARVIADSISSWGKRLTTFEIEYPRFIHAEFMTHRLFSRNCASSRAIPSKKVFDLVAQSPAIPIHWGKNQSGMQAYQEHNQAVVYKDKTYTANEFWMKAKDSSIAYASALANASYHKQITNRLVEPFQMIKAVVTATEYDNFYWLRNHHASQPEIKELAECMLLASNESQPTLRIRSDILINNNNNHDSHDNKNNNDNKNSNNKNIGFKNEYHLPYVSNEEREQYLLEDIIKLSVARCAAVSYRNEDYQLDKSKQIYDRLIGEDRKHSSALEHIARIMNNPQVSNNLSLNLLEDGISHIDREGNLWSGNFKGWIQYRKLIKDECCWDYTEPT